jgi:hypothetical protein
MHSCKASTVSAARRSCSIRSPGSFILAGLVGECQRLPELDNVPLYAVGQHAGKM